MILLPMVDEVYHHAFLKKLSNFLKPLKMWFYQRYRSRMTSNEQGIRGVKISSLEIARYSFLQKEYS